MISLKRQGINTTISERYATIVYSFDFHNTNNIENHSDELRFAITIDPNAFIAGFTADIDGELFIGRTEEKKEAKQEYIAAKAKNENAILISQPNKDISNVFEIKTNIDSGSKISLNITIEQYLKKTFNFNQLNIQILNDFSGTTVRKHYSDIEYKFEVKDKRGISGLSIPLYNGQIDNKNKYIYNIDGIITAHQLSLTNELVLKYKVDGEADESSLLFDEKSNTFCHIISDIITDAKQENNDTEGDVDGNNIFNIPRRVVFVIDKSGSMYGNKWNYTVKATIIALKKLRNGIDRYRIILCGSQLDYIPKNINKLELVQESSINNSITYLEAQSATGSEQLNQGLLEGIKAIKYDIISLNNDKNVEYNFFMNQIIFISDGRPTIGECNVDKIITNVKNANDISKLDKYSNKISVFSFGVGRDGNGSQWMNDLPHEFLKSLSVNNNGFYKRIRQKTADTELSQYIDIISKPISTNIKIEYSHSNNLTQTKFHSLYDGNDLIVCGKLNKNTKSISAMISSIICKKGKPVTINKQIKMNINDHDYDYADDDNKDDESNNVERIWAYLSLQQHATEKLRYNDMIEMDEDEQKQHDKLALQLAMKYKFVTPWTSCIVVKEKKQQNEKKNEEQKMINIPAPNTPPSELSFKSTAILPEIFMDATPFSMEQRPRLSLHADYSKFVTSIREVREHPPIPPILIQQQQQQLSAQRLSLQQLAAQQRAHMAASGMTINPVNPQQYALIQQQQQKAAALSSMQTSSIPQQAAHQRYQSMGMSSQQLQQADYQTTRLMDAATNRAPTAHAGYHSVSQLSGGGGGGHTSASMLEVNPLIEDMKPAERKRLIGERLFPKIQVYEPRLAGKITAMLLKMDNTELLVLLSEQRALMNKINEALTELKNRSDSSEQKEKKKKEIKEAQFEVYNKNGIWIVFNFDSLEGRILAVIVNRNAFKIINFSLKITVPEYIKLEMKPANSTKLLAKSKNRIEQTIKLNNTKHGEKPYTIGIEIIYTENGKQQTDKSKVIIPDDYFNKT